jgi:hypothetical protein
VLLVHGEADPALPPLLVVRAGRDHPESRRVIRRVLAFLGEHLTG